MSGIFGIVDVSGARRLERDLGAMRDAMAFWGRDGERRWEGEGIALGHLLQAVTTSRRGAPSSPALPCARDVVVTADVRLVNRDELHDELGARPRQPLTDEELILEAYLRWGERCVERLAGAFAFAVWDGRSRRLLCARDHAGLRPFVYWDGPGCFAFATDAEAVVACEGIPRRPDEEVLVARFSRHPMRRERTHFEGVAKLPPGQLLVFEPGRGTRRRRHWLPERCAPRSFADAGECARTLRDTLALATADAVDTDAGVGAHISGGLDSATAAALAQRALRREGRSLVRGFSWAPPANSANGDAAEHERIEAVAGALGAPMTYTSLRDADLRADALRDDALEPNDMLLFEHLVLAEAARHGIGVMVSGWGGDQVASFNGRGQLAWLLLRGRWRTLWREAASPARSRGALNVARTASRNIVKRALVPLLPDRVYELLPMSETPAARRLHRRGHGWAELHPLAPGLRREMLRRSRLRRSPRLTQLAVLGLGNLETRVESWARAGARAGVDYRYPMLDRRVLELGLSMPGDVWLRDGWSRWIFRRAIDPLLPPAVVWSPREKDDPVLMSSWRDLLVGARLEDVSGESELVRARRRREQELARMWS